jgi:aryl-alcohol dehydrogenase-like predicted oxidoreductase
MMKYRILGRSGLKVSEICLGTMTFGTEFHWGSTKKTSREIFELFYEHGGNFIDTANYYTKGTSETYLGEFLKDRREKFVVATKYTLSTDPKDPNASGNHRKNLMQSLEASLKRLKTDYVDLYWVHAWDGLTPIDEMMRALDDAVKQGKVLYVGISDAPAWVVSQANTLADWKGWTPFVGLQIEYSLIERTPERELLPMAKSLDLAVLAWSPLGMGVLTGKYNSNKGEKKRFDINPTWGKQFLNKHNLDIAAAVVNIAKKLRVTPAQVAVNWVRQNQGIVIPIIGAKDQKQLKDSLGCLSFKLDDKNWKTLEEISQIDLGFPRKFLQQDGVKKLLFGDFEETILSHRGL